MSSSSSLQESLTDFMSSEPNAILFAGAGVSAAAGLPTWFAYLKALAEATRKDDPFTADHMIHKLADSDLLGAADLYFLSRKIPQPEKYQNLKSPIQSFDARPLHKLMALPFKAVVTTNFDRALFDACAAAKKKAAEEVNLCDPSLAAAPFNNAFYIARIHGRIEVPETIRLGNYHFQALAKDSHYQDFLAHQFVRERILFVGFSFLDPAIRNVLEIVEAEVGKYHHGRHLALLPVGSPSELAKRLADFSIRVIEYDAQHEHRELWASIDRLSLTDIGAKRTTKPAGSDPFAATQRYLSACYARSTLGRRAHPLRQTVVEGIVATVIRDAGGDGADEKSIIEAVSDTLTLNLEDTRGLVDHAINSLRKDGLIRAIADSSLPTRFCSDGKLTEESFGSGLNALISGVLDRFVVRTGTKPKSSVSECLRIFFERIVSKRGWDLGVAFASGEFPQQLDVHKFLQAIGTCTAALSPHALRELGRAAEDLIQRPNQKEAQILVELGRTSFALELVSRAPRDTLLHELTLPERVYLDANVLLPALAPGHPFHDVYKRTLARLGEAAAPTLAGIELVAYRGFLNEIVSHRRIAVERMQNADQADLATLRKEAQLYGSSNMNVYVSGFANSLANDRSLTFEQYLQRNASYVTESELAPSLARLGIHVEDDLKLKEGADELPDILHALEKANSNIGWKRKEGMLVQHDAVQVAALARDLRRGKKTIFVSADRKLKSNLTDIGLDSCANAILSHIGLTQLVDLLVGSHERDRGAAAMIWGGRVSNESEQVRNYLINVALDQYDQAIAMKMGDLVDDIAEDALAELHRQGLQIDEGASAQRPKVIEVLDGFAEKFFAAMREAIERDQAREQDH